MTAGRPNGASPNLTPGVAPRPPRRVSRTGWVVVLLAACMAGLLAGAQSQSELGGGFGAAWAHRVLAPVLSGLTQAGRRLGDAWLALTATDSLAADNRRLHAEVDRLERQLVLADQHRQEAVRLRALLAVRQEHDAPVVAARVIGRSPSPWFATLALDRGQADGVREGCAVVAAGGLVGQVIAVAERSCQVLGLADTRARVAVRLLPERARRVAGVAEGTGDGRLLLRFPDATAPVQVGDAVITSGEEVGSLFPPGLRIGQVVGLDRRPHESALACRVAPAAPIESVEEALIVLPADPASTETASAEATVSR